MVSARQLPPEIGEALSRGAAVVTANQRSARMLRRLYDEQQHRSGATSWQTASVLSWEAWTGALWHELVLSGDATSLLLNRTQELSLWRSIITADAELRTLRQPDALAHLAADAWKALHSYGQTGPLTGSASSTDETAFRRWAADFRIRCRRESLITSAELEDVLHDGVRSSKLSVATTALVLVGFDQHTPAERRLLDALARRSLPITHFHARLETRARSWFRADTLESEQIACARWARAHFARNPQCRLGVIVPDLSSERAGLERSFRDVVAPELHNIASGANTPYEFSLGDDLAKTASVSVALDLLAWTQHPLAVSAVSRFLLSRYLAGSSFYPERRARALFNARRGRRSRRLRPELSLQDLLAHASTSDVPVPGLTAALHAFDLASAPMREAADRSYSVWSERIRAALAAAGWTPYGESSLEFQIRQRWEGCLDELATLDFSGEPVPFARVLDELRRILHETTFAPESHDAPIQILGPLEAAGSTFDGVWFLRCGDLTFPSTPAANPLLPWRLRRSLRLPGSNAVQDGQQAEQVMRRIAASAPEVVLSFAEHIDQGRQRLSPAAHSLHLAEVQSANLPSLAASAEAASSLTLEPVRDVLPLPAPPDRVLQGGASVLEAQAACGFRAFALHRLFSKPLEEAAFGLDAPARGEVVHQVLQLFWEEVKTQDALRAMSPGDREACLQRHIVKTLQPWSSAAETAWDQAYLDVQVTRLRSVLKHWMEQELQRAPFEVVRREQRYDELAVGPLRLSVRVDRLDQTASGAVLIDYKTGSSKPAQWLTHRPDAPQLPLYSMLPEASSLAAVAFATIRPGKEMRFSGFEAKKGVLPKALKMPAESLEAQQAEWRDVLEELASGFYAGDTRVQPKSFPKTCTYCAQRLLCRLNPNTLVEQMRDEMEEEDDSGHG